MNDYEFLTTIELTDLSLKTLNDKIHLDFNTLLKTNGREIEISFQESNPVKTLVYQINDEYGVVKGVFAPGLKLIQLYYKHGEVIGEEVMVRLDKTTLLKGIIKEVAKAEEGGSLKVYSSVRFMES